MSLPNGTVTFLFTDIEGSAKLWEQSPEAMPSVLARHDTLLRQVVERQGGFVFKTVGDGIYAAFATAPEALAAALTAQKEIHSAAWPSPLRVRMALHTGAAEQRDDDYFGATLNRTARLLAFGQGGQVLLSAVTQELTRDCPPPQATLRNLGEVRLRDLTQTEHVFQLLHPDLPANFPPLRSLTSPGYPNNLPQQVTPLIGRKKESAEIVCRLQSSRLITLIGAGGCGKTRLALQATADALPDYADGVWFIELASLTDFALVPQTVANILKIQEEAGKPLFQTFVERLQARKTVLILDNCEHLLAAVADFAAGLLRVLPHLRIVAASREPLNISGETVYRVPSLTLPHPKQVHTAKPFTIRGCAAFY